MPGDDEDDLRETGGEQDGSEEDAGEETYGPSIPRADLLICLALLLATFAAYAGVFGYGFFWLDDGKYVAGNLHVHAGLTAANLRWVFLSFDPDNWFPVTRLSLLSDYALFGMHAGAYHAENVAIHAFASILLFGFLRRATSVRWPCAFVSAVFALHPLHVESVAWISERKDVLCAFFWFAALWAWLRYSERPGTGRYLFALLLFLMGLMSKPMIVTFPIVLLLMDQWPLRRGFSFRLVAEKVPFLILSCGVAVLTVAAQKKAGDLQSLHLFPIGLRFENALVTVAAYIGETLWPGRLWLAHAFPRSIPGWQAVAAGAGIVAVSIAALTQWRQRPWLAVGWLWFLATLIPVIGLVQVGLQGRADRYMYVPMVGLSIMAAWGGADVVAQGARGASIRTWMAGLFVCIAMAVRTSAQTQYWQDAQTALRHAVAIDADDYVAWSYLGAAILAEGGGRAMEPKNESLPCFRAAIRVRPDIAVLHSNLATALGEAGRWPEAPAEYREAIRLEPDSAPTHSMLGATLFRMGRPEEALAELERALRLNPRLASAHSCLGYMLCRKRETCAEGLRHLEQAVEIDPESAQAQSWLGQVLVNSPDRVEEGVRHLREALRINPAQADAHVGLASVMLRVPGMREEAIGHLREAQRLEPNAELAKKLESLQ